MAKTGVKKDNKTLDIKTVCECCHCLGSKTLHPQVSLINLEKPELEEDASEVRILCHLVDRGLSGRLLLLRPEVL